MTRKFLLRSTSLTLAAGAISLAGAAQADQVILDDLIVDGSACIGFDCVNGESFGFDTLRLKENNLRIKAQDTSSSASFPTNDWQITFNETNNGGANKFSIDDIDNSRTPFTIEAGAPSHSLYVDDGGRIGLGTSTPVVEVHVKDGDTPTVRLEQDGSSGFTAQTWDMAGNETNWFVRDATTGSRLPLRIRPAAPSNSIFIDTDGDVGMGTSSPSADFDNTGNTQQAALHVRSTDGTSAILVEEASTTTSNTRIQLQLQNNGSAQMALFDSNNSSDWRVQNLNDRFRVTKAGTGVAEMELDNAGNLTIQGTLTVIGGGGGTVPDYVFADDYRLMPLDEVEKFIVENRHLPRIPSARDVEARGLNMTEMQMALLEKVEELTLYTLQQQKMIDELQRQLAAR